MKNYSQFTVEYVNDICNELKSKGFIADRYLEKTFEPENFETLTNFLQGYIVKSFEVYTHLDNLGLVNRGKCPYTGERIDSSFPSWSFMNTRKVYVSHKGYQIMQKKMMKNLPKLWVLQCLKEIFLIVIVQKLKQEDVILQQLVMEMNLLQKFYI